MRFQGLAVVLLLTAGGCARGERSSDTAVVATSSPADDRARTAAAVANAIERNPAGADSILRAAGYTRESFQQAMYEIAADSAQSAAYTAAKGR
jgi:hypothetical protein